MALHDWRRRAALVRRAVGRPEVAYGRALAAAAHDLDVRERAARAEAWAVGLRHQPLHGLPEVDCATYLAEGRQSLGPALDETQLAEVHAWLKGREVRDAYRPELDTFPAESPPPDAHVGYFSHDDVRRAPHLTALANAPKHLAFAQQVLGARPTISNLSIWWSYVPDGGPRESQFFHRDHDAPRIAKLFVYLTDVTEDTGPHIYVPGSIHHNKLTKMRRFDDAEVEAAFGAERIEAITGSAGDSFFVDTVGVHKGALPRSGRRLLFQATYTCFPTWLTDYPDNRFACPQGWDPYVNRLYFEL